MGRKSQFLVTLEKTIKELEKLNQDFRVCFMPQHNSNRKKEIAGTIKHVLSKVKVKNRIK